MFHFYAEAEECYVYLSDFDLGCPQLSDYNFTNWIEAFKKSRWFSRGWTLQELLTPVRLSFFSENWTIVGYLEDLISTVSDVTKTSGDVLLHVTPLHDVPLAKRMSWAANRQTTRIEDRAYSLLGIFEVNIPMLYGEREKALIRLQHEIVKSSTDESIFAWWHQEVDDSSKPPNNFRLEA